MSSRRLALTPAIGLFTGLSVVSFGAVSMWLTGVHGSPAHASNPCSTNKTNTHTTAAAYTAVGRSGSRAGHAARLPILLDAAARTISWGPAAHHAASQAATAATASSPPLPSSSPFPSTPAPPTPNPSPGGGNVTPSSSPNSTPNPGSTGNIPGNGGGGVPTVRPGGTNSSPTPTPTATPTPTKTATPTPTSTTTPPPSATLCLSVQTLGGSNTVDPGTTVHYAIWVWLTSGTNGSAKIEVDARPSRVNPSFTVCEPTGGSKCTVSGLKAGLHVQTQAKLRAAKDLAGRDITLTVTATSKEAINSATATDKIEVSKPKTKHHSSSPTPTPTYNPNAGYGSYPGSNSGSYPGVSNPYGNLGSALPPVSPSPNVSPSTAAGQQQHQHQVEVTDLSAGLPLDVRLIGGQVIGLAILAAAITIAVARLSLRRQPPKHSEDSASSTPAS
jgi:hypothetical protein